MAQNAFARRRFPIEMIFKARVATRFLLSFSVLGAVLVLLHRPAATAIVGPRQEDAIHGKELFEKYCAQCHRLDNNKKGPKLRGVFGRKAGTVPGFIYSEALRKTNVIWDSESLDKWLTDPDKFIPENDMDFQVKDADERAAIIAYLKQLSN